MCLTIILHAHVHTLVDHLRGVTISNSKLFTVHGDLSQRQSLVWKDHGFELHFPVNTCLPGEECEVTVDAVVGGDFVFPEGVEPVSAIFIISVTSKLRKPSLLRMKHCVALEKISKQSCLSFYRASLKEQKPPYHFRKLKGGFFDLKSQFGELELPAFCSLTVCKDSGASSGDEATSDSQSVEGMSTSSGFCSESEQEVSAPTQDGRMSQSSARISENREIDSINNMATLQYVNYSTSTVHVHVHVHVMYMYIVNCL